MPHSTPSLFLTLCMVLVSLVACTPGADSSTRPAPAASLLAACPEGRFATGALCGRLPVLEDRARPDGRTLDLAIVLLPATEKNDPKLREPLFLLAGGPGQAATDLLTLVQGPLAPVREHRDIVLVDQRGTGDSNPLDCPNGSARDPQRAFGQLFDPENVRTCAERLAGRADVRLYATSHAVDDLEQVRRTLGYERVVLWGGSGGTRTAQIWLRRHPESIAAMLLDGVTPNDFRAPSGYAAGVDRSFERMAEDCRSQPSCQARYSDLTGDLERILHRFDDGPVIANLQTNERGVTPVEMSRDDFGYALRGQLYNARSIATLPGRIAEAASSGNLDFFAQALWERDVALRTAVAMGVHWAVFCAEDIPFLERERIPELTDGTVLGTYLIDQYRSACEAWPHEPVGREFLEPVHSTVPTLLISGYYDPSTPPEGAERAAEQLSRNRHLVVRNQSHGAEFGCARELVTEFLSSSFVAGDPFAQLPGVCEGVGPIVFSTD